MNAKNALPNEHLDKLAEAAESLVKRNFSPARSLALPTDPANVTRIGHALCDLAASLEAEYQQLEQLDQIATRISEGILLDEVLDGVYDGFRGAIPFDRIGFAVLSHGGTKVTARWARTDLDEVRLGKGFSAPLLGSSLDVIIKTGQPRILNDLEEYLRQKPESHSTRLIVEEGLRSSLTCPLVANGIPLGFLFFSSRKRNAYVGVHVDVFLRIAGQLSGLVEKGQIISELAESRRQLTARNEFISTVFGRYVPSQVVEKVATSVDAPKLGGERKTITMILSDLRGFTSMAERLAPEQVLSVVNNLVEEMTPVVGAHGGTINEITGDSLLVLFGAPIASGDDALRAVACAVDMQLAMTRVNERNARAGVPQVQMGIGVHTGDVVVGNIGSEERMKYGVVGRSVNLTSRIESFTVGGQVLVSQATLDAAGAGLVETTGSLEVEAKGVSQQLTVHDVTGVGGRYGLRLPRHGANLATLVAALPIRFARLNGTDAGGAPESGSIVRISPTTAEVSATRAVRVFDNVRLEILGPTGQVIVDGILGKVVPGDVSVASGFLVHFTFLPPDAEALIRSSCGTP